jgi:pimeloyl-ACP methyl ester carboxylesterase
VVDLEIVLAFVCHGYNSHASAHVTHSTHFSQSLRLTIVLGIVIASALAAETSPVSGDFAGLVRIAGGRGLYLQCSGTGSPTVLLEAGLRVRSDYWSHNTATPTQESVFPGIARFTHVCAYDRPGTVIGTAVKDRSRSNPVAMPRSAISVVDDLHALVESAHLPRPLVLVGHSMGGLFIRIYAHKYPDDVSGLVLVDALPDGLQQHMTAAQYSLFVRLNTEIPKSLKSYKNFYETIPFGPAFEVLRELQAAKPLKPMPLVVLSRGLAEPIPAKTVPPGFSAALEKAWRTQQDALVKIEPGAQQIIAAESDHYIMLRQPGLVIRAVRDVVQAIHSGLERVQSPA